MPEDRHDPSSEDHEERAAPIEAVTRFGGRTARDLAFWWCPDRPHRRGLRECRACKTMRLFIEAHAAGHARELEAERDRLTEQLADRDRMIREAELRTLRTVTEVIRKVATDWETEAEEMERKSEA